MDLVTYLIAYSAIFIVNYKTNLVRMDKNKEFLGRHSKELCYFYPWITFKTYSYTYIQINLCFILLGTTAWDSSPRNLKGASKSNEEADFYM